MYHATTVKLLQARRMKKQALENQRTVTASIQQPTSRPDFFGGEILSPVTAPFRREYVRTFVERWGHPPRMILTENLPLEDRPRLFDGQPLLPPMQSRHFPARPRSTFREWAEKLAEHGYHITPPRESMSTITASDPITVPHRRWVQCANCGRQSRTPNSIRHVKNCPIRRSAR